MNKPMIVTTSLAALTLIVGVCHADSEEYLANLETLEAIFGDGKKINKLYSGKRQPDAELAQIWVRSGLTITAVDDRSVKTTFLKDGYKAYEQLPGTYVFEVTSWKSQNVDRYIGEEWGKLDKQAAYALEVVLEAGQRYVVSPIWNDGEMRIISPSQVCLQGQSDSARYCALRPRESDDVFAMDEKHGVIVVSLTRSRLWEKVIVINLDCEWKSTDRYPRLNSRKPATKLRDVCFVAFELTDSKGYTIESVDAGVWKWWGAAGVVSGSPRITTNTFDVEPGKINYIGHVATANPDGKLRMFGPPVGFTLADHFSLIEPILRAGFGDAEIVNMASELPGPRTLVPTE